MTDSALYQALKAKIDQKTKPLGSLGRLEEIAIQIGMIQGTLTPKIENPELLVFAGDHGIAAEGVSAYPQEVTYQMVRNFLNGGAAISVLSREAGLTMRVVDSGVNFDFVDETRLVNKKIAMGTQSFLTGPAMSPEQMAQAMAEGENIVEELFYEGCNLMALGEMGIANTSSAALIIHLLTGTALVDCVGAGTGLDGKAIERKMKILSSALINFQLPANAVNVLTHFGGFEIAMMCGAILKAAACNMVILVDGFITTAAVIAAMEYDAAIFKNCIFSHVSHEKGHRMALKKLGAAPLLDLNLRLGEGTGAALAFSLVKASLAILNEMHSFEEAHVSKEM